MHKQRLIPLKPLFFSFKNSANSSYGDDLKTHLNILPLHKKNYKRFVNNYQSIPLLPIFGKNFENDNFLLEENLLNPNQSAFCSSDSCVNRLLAITHEISEAFNCNPSLEVMPVFLKYIKSFFIRFGIISSR